MTETSLWTEHQSAEGKSYWVNTRTRETVWEEPKELILTADAPSKVSQDTLNGNDKENVPVEVDQMKWQEHTASDGKKYYFNIETKESRWDYPDNSTVLAEVVVDPTLMTCTGGGSRTGDAAYLPLPEDEDDLY